MIGKTRHTEVTPEGKFIYIIKPHYRDDHTRQITNEHNDKFTGRRLKVPFHAGIGRTTSRTKAQKFSEEFEYFVYLHKDDKPWIEAGERAPSNTLVIEDEESTYVIDEEADIDEDEELV